jgi:hypothetical protein
MNENFDGATKRCQILEFGGFKMKLKKMLAGPLLALALAFPHAVSAEDFTFNVPVNFSNIHEEADRIMVSCKVFKGQILSNEGLIGNSAKFEDVPGNGNLNKTIQVKFNAHPNKNRAEADNYECSMSVMRGSSGSFVRPSNSNFCNSPSDDWRCTKEGTTYKNPTSGPIP